MSIKQLAKHLTDSITMCPGEWTFDMCDSHNARLGAEIWHANKEGFLKISINKTRINDNNIVFGWLVPWRRKLYAAIKPNIPNQKAALIEEVLAKPVCAK